MRIIWVLVLAACVACAPSFKQTGNELKTGDAIPVVRLENLRGEAVSLEDLRGKPVLVNAWGVWCAPCVAELPVLRDLQEKFRADGLVIIGIDVKDSRAKLTDFLEKNPLNYDVWVQGDKTDDVLSLLRRWQSFEDNAASIPYSFGVGRDGKIKGVVGGYDGTGQGLRDLVRDLLK